MRSAKEAATQCLALIQAHPAPAGGRSKTLVEAVLTFTVGYLDELMDDFEAQYQAKGIHQGAALVGLARSTEQRWLGFLNRLDRAGEGWVRETNDLFRVALHDFFNHGPALARELWPTWTAPAQETLA